MENDKIGAFNPHDANRWERLPDTVERGECFKETCKGIVKLSYYTGKFTIKSQQRSCIIREFIADAAEVYSKAENELFIMSRLKNGTSILLVDIFGFVIEPILDCQNLMKYTLVTQSYESTLVNFTQKRFKVKINLLFQLVQFLYLMKQRRIFHGALRPEFIYVDQNEQITLGDLFWAYRYKLNESAAEYFSFLDLLEEKFLAPEIIILKLNKNWTVGEIDFIAADIFSVGLLILFFFNDYKSYNQLTGNAQHNLDFINRVVIQKSECNFPVLNISIKNNDLCEMIKDCLRYDKFHRTKYRGIIATLTCLRVNGDETHVIEDSQIAGISEDFNKLLNDFQKLLKHLHEKKGSRFFTIPYINFAVSWHLDKFKEDLEKYHKAYLLTECRSESVNMIEGIGYFISEFYFDLKNGIITKNFRDTINRTNSLPNYKDFMINFYTLDKTLQDYILTGLVAQSHIDDWEYFFPTSMNEIRYCRYTKLCDLQNLYAEFREFIMHPYIKEKLNSFIPKGFDLEKIVDDLVLQRVYILEIQPSLHGLTTYNGNIFLSSFKRDLRILDPEHKACILLTLIHELAHLLRRIACLDYNEARNKYSPKDNKDSEKESAEHKTENQIYKNRGEAGEAIEIMILGESLSSINRNAATYLLEKNFEDPGFREKLKRKNESKINRAIMGKSKEPFANGIRCGFKRNHYT